MNTKLIAPILLTLVLTACGGGGGGGGSGPATPSVSKLTVSHISNTNTVNNITAADLNGDGLEDIIVSGWNYDRLTAYVYIFIQNSDGSLTDKTNELLSNNVIEGSQRILVADFDSDGHVDIFVPGFSDGSQIYAAHSIMFWGSAGQYVREDWSDKNAAHGACIGDLNNDGLVDILSAGGGYSGGDVGGIYINNGHRSFTLQPSSLLGSNQFEACAVIKDGADSLIYLSGNTFTVGYRDRIIKVQPDLSIVSDTLIADNGYDSVDVIATDLNSDGHQDFVVITNNTSVTLPGPTKVYTNDGSGSFALSATLSMLRSAFYGRALTVDGVAGFFVSGDTNNATIYKGTTRYKSASFTDMAQTSNSFQDAGVYQNSSTGKLYMLELINNTFYTKEIQ